MMMRIRPIGCPSEVITVEDKNGFWIDTVTGDILGAIKFGVPLFYELEEEGFEQDNFSVRRIGA